MKSSVAQTVLFSLARECVIYVSSELYGYIELSTQLPNIRDPGGSDDSVANLNLLAGQKREGLV